VTGGLEIRRGSAFTQHLLDGSPGTRWIRRKTNETTSQINGQGVEDALGEVAEQGSGQWLVASR